MKKHSMLLCIICLGMMVLSTAPPLNAQEFTSNLIVAHKALNSLGFYTADGKHLTTIDVGPNPHEMAFSPDRTLVYITNNGVMRWTDTADGGNTVSIVDVTTRKKVGEISTGEFRRPHGIYLDQMTGLLAVTCEKPDRLLLIDPVERTILRDYPPGGITSHNVTLDRGAVWAYVTNILSNTIGAVNLYTGEVTEIPTGSGPQDCVISKDGKELYVACGNYIGIIDIEKKTEIGNMGNGAVRIDITPDGRQLVTAAHPAAVEFFDPSNRRQLGRVELSGDPFSISISADGKFAFTGAEGDNEFYVVSIAERRIVRHLKTIDGAGPDPVLDIPKP